MNVVKELVPLKTFVPIKVTELGIEIVTNDDAPLKAFEAMFVNESGKDIDLMPVSPQNALAPIVVTLLSRTTSPAHLVAGAGKGRKTTPWSTK